MKKKWKLGKIMARTREDWSSPHAWWVRQSEANRKIKELEFRVERLEEYAQKLETAGDTLATLTLRNGRSHEQWHKAKESKP